MSNPDWKFETLSVHAGYSPDPTTKAVAVPIYQTVAYAFDSAQHGADLFDLKVPGNIYTRIMNPTTSVLEARVAALEGGIGALAVASGQSAITYAIQTIAEAGDNIVSSTALYGGTYNLFAHTFPQFGITTRFADHKDPASFEALIDERTKAIFVESLGNPAGNVTDIARIAEIAHRHGVPLIVDNTVPSPYLLRPIEFGADIVVHSLTKYLGGHGTSLGGAIIDSGRFDWAASDKFGYLSQPNPSYHGKVFTEAFGPAAFIVACRALGLRDLGPSISPFNAFMILTGIETLPLRMQRHADNALAVAKWLEANDKVAWVSYAGLDGNPYNALAKRYTPNGAGSVFSFGLKGGYQAGVKLVGAVNLFSHLANLGDTRSLIIHPASTTHRQLDEKNQIAAGAGPDVIRLSVGIENVADLIADLDQAFAGL